MMISDHVQYERFILTLAYRSNEILYMVIDQSKVELKRAAGVKNLGNAR